MKKFVKNSVVLIIVALSAVIMSVCCFAMEQGKIAVMLEDKENGLIDGVTVKACQVISLVDGGYYPAKQFEKSGISVETVLSKPDQSTAKNVADYVEKNALEVKSAVSENGKAEFDNLPLGVWLVFPDQNSDCTFNPYLVFLPYESEGKLYYEVKSTPKLESNSSQISIYVIKKWDDKNNAAKKRPQAVTVELLNGEKVVSSVKLSEENGWAHTFSGISKNGDYSVREKAVENYKADYSGDKANGFIITNTYAGEKLPQAGQYWWPIILIAVAGLCFIALGVYEIGAKKNGKKR